MIAVAMIDIGSSGCGGAETTAPGPSGSTGASGASALADFSLPDVNPTSPTFNASVSPRDHLGKVSAWYFGHAT